ncbi:hypothetical protein [Mycolicibacterium baixiangningiae]|uniref:hypothetical protein n=1 Tax=Mycolicibacterium baixiangningiae TaxID=2761578 RepID=UPI001868A87F|nr:hypothetical protein [Mycolicibacterium baixiangningiae]
MSDSNTAAGDPEDLTAAERSIRDKLGALDEVELTLQQPAQTHSLSDDDIEIVTATFRVPSSVLLGSMRVTRRRRRIDPSLADNDSTDPSTFDGHDPAI